MEKKKNVKRILAIVGLVLIGIMVIATLLAAVFDKSGQIFRSFLILTIALPIALWIFIWAYGAMTNKHTGASFDLNLGLQDGTEDDDSKTETDADE